MCSDELQHIVFPERNHFEFMIIIEKVTIKPLQIVDWQWKMRQMSKLLQIFLQDNFQTWRSLSLSANKMVNFGMKLTIWLWMTNLLTPFTLSNEVLMTSPCSVISKCSTWQESTIPLSQALSPGLEHWTLKADSAAHKRVNVTKSQKAKKRILRVWQSWRDTKFLLLLIVPNSRLFKPLN